VLLAAVICMYVSWAFLYAIICGCYCACERACAGRTRAVLASRENNLNTLHPAVLPQPMVRFANSISTSLMTVQKQVFGCEAGKFFSLPVSILCFFLTRRANLWMLSRPPVHHVHLDPAVGSIDYHIPFYLSDLESKR
jgi:hypothetical protein